MLLAHYKDRKDMALGTALGLEGRSGVSNSALSRYLKKQAAANIDHLHRIAVAYDLPVWFLLHPSLHLDNPPRVQTPQAAAEVKEVLAAALKMLASEGGLHERINAAGVGETGNSITTGPNSSKNTTTPKRRTTDR